MTAAVFCSWRRIAIISRVGEFRVGAAARAAGAVGAGDAAEPVVVAGEAVEDAVEGHELEIVLMGADAEVGDARRAPRLRVCRRG